MGNKKRINKKTKKNNKLKKKKNKQKFNIVSFTHPPTRNFCNDKTIKIVTNNKREVSPLKYVSLHDNSFAIFETNHKYCRTFYFFRKS